MATLLKGDCLELMKGLPDKSVDCFVCDLPYGQLSTPKIGDGGKAYVRFPVERCAWDVKIDLTAFWEQVERLCKDDHTPVLMFCNTRFGIDLINSNPKWFRYDLVWDKGHGVSFLLANKMPMKSHEMIYVFSKAGSYYKRIDIKTDRGEWTIDRSKDKRPHSLQYGVKRCASGIESGGIGGMRCPLSVIPIGGKCARNSHPTQKPEELYEWLLSRYCPAGGTMLDPTAGSFNSVFVARRLGLKAIGMEMDKGFYYKALVRLLQIPKNTDNVITHV
jgi:site-specific DNA-methyltransferase (adenine-specific)